MSKTWRDIARPIIAEILDPTKNRDDKTIKDLLKKAYPFGERKYHPYKIWLDEIKVQTKQRKFGEKKKPIDKNQT